MSASALRRVRIGITAVAGVVLCAALVTAALIPAPYAGARAKLRVADPLPLSTNELIMTLGRLGLSPERLAAAGLTAVPTAGTVTRLREHLAEEFQSLRDADAALNSAAANFNHLRGLIESGRAAAEDIAAFAAAKQAKAAATSQLQGLTDVAFAAATVHLDEGPKARLIAMRGNARWEVPVQYLTVSRSEADWVTLRNAISAQQVAARTGTEVSAAHTQAVLTAAANETVVAAATGLTTNLAAIQTAWDNAVAE